MKNKYFAGIHSPKGYIVGFDPVDTSTSIEKGMGEVLRRLRPGIRCGNPEIVDVFMECKNPFGYSLDVDGWDIANVTDMSKMFQGDISNIDSALNEVISRIRPGGFRRTGPGLLEFLEDGKVISSYEFITLDIGMGPPNIRTVLLLDKVREKYRELLSGAVNESLDRIRPSRLVKKTRPRFEPLNPSYEIPYSPSADGIDKMVDYMESMWQNKTTIDIASIMKNV